MTFYQTFPQPNMFLKVHQWRPAVSGRIWGRKAHDLGPKNAEFGTEKHEIEFERFGAERFGATVRAAVFGT
jgi:hypothetical protein